MVVWILTQLLLKILIVQSDTDSDTGVILNSKYYFHHLHCQRKIAFRMIVITSVMGINGKNRPQTGNESSGNETSCIPRSSSKFYSNANRLLDTTSMVLNLVDMRIKASNKSVHNCF